MVLHACGDVNPSSMPGSCETFGRLLVVQELLLLNGQIHPEK